MEDACFIHDFIEGDAAAGGWCARTCSDVMTRSFSSPLLHLWLLLFLLDDSGALLALGNPGRFLALDDMGTPPLMPLLYFCLLRTASSPVAYLVAISKSSDAIRGALQPDFVSELPTPESCGEGHDDVCVLHFG